MFLRHRFATPHRGRPASVWPGHFQLTGRPLLALLSLIVLALGSLPLSPAVATAAPSLWPDGVAALQWDSPAAQPAGYDYPAYSAYPYATTYVVRRGDTLTRIARRFGTTIGALAAANHLASVDFVWTGERLIIRSAAPAQASAPALSSAPDQASAPAPAPAPAPATLAAPTAGRWIDVDLTHQVLVAYDGTTPVFTTLVSSGLPGSPTVTGTYHIYVKYLSTLMVGPGYYLPNVPYTMYFYEGYGIHGTYWHHNFGHPMSHGCLNVSTPDAAWLYGFASVGTPVVIHN